jgi:hypothetical protein
MALRFCSFNVSTFAESLSMRRIFLFLISSSLARARPMPPLPRTAYAAFSGFILSYDLSSIAKPPYFLIDVLIALN